MRKEHLLQVKKDIDYLLMTQALREHKDHIIQKYGVIFSVRKYKRGAPKEKPFTRKDKDGLFCIIHYPHWSVHYTDWEDQIEYTSEACYTIKRTY